MWWFVFRVAVLFCILLPIATVFAQKSMVFIPSKKMGYTPKNIGIDFKELTVGTNKLNCWWIPVKEEGAKTVIFCHGNAGNISHRLDTVDFYHNVMKCNLIIFDYSGYGKSGGNVGEKACYKDSQEVYDYVTKTLKVDSKNIIIHGRSLGGAVAIDLAVNRKCAGLVMESTFTSIPDMADDMVPIFPIQWFVRIKFDSIDKIDQLKVPILLIHSEEDEVIPYAMGEELFEQAKKPKFWLKISGDHNGGWIESQKVYSKGMKDFFEAL